MIFTILSIQKIVLLGNKDKCFNLFLNSILCKVKQLLYTVIALANINIK